MVDNFDKKPHLIDDQGVYHDQKPLQAAVFITGCRLITAALVILGIMALITEYY